jgi:hypothetical protein
MVHTHICGRQTHMHLLVNQVNKGIQALRKLILTKRLHIRSLEEMVSLKDIKHRIGLPLVMCIKCLNYLLHALGSMKNLGESTLYLGQGIIILQQWKLCQRIRTTTKVGRLPHKIILNRQPTHQWLG